MSMGRVRITIEFLDKPWKPSTVEMDGMVMTQEAGIHRTHRMDPTPELTHNGQQRVVIHAWKGCQSYDSFQPDTENTELFG